MLRRVLLSLAVVLALAAVPAAAELTMAASEPTSAVPFRESTPRTDLAREALRQSPPVMTVSNAIRRVLLRLTLFFLVASAALAVAATVSRTRVTVVRCPGRTVRARVSPPDRAPPAFA